MAKKRKKVSSNYLFVLFKALLLTIVFVSFVYLVYAYKSYSKTTDRLQNANLNQNFVNKPENNILPKISSIKIPFLIYHYVEFVRDQRDTIRKSLDIYPTTFENQLITLKDYGYTFIYPRDIPKILNGEIFAPKKPVIISFDDGYEDFYTDVLPIIKRQDTKAVVYIVSDFLDRPNYLTSVELEDVAKSGIVEIACHTAHHLNLKAVPQALAEYEISTCKQDLKKRFNVNAVSFAYPYGAYYEALAPILETNGFTNAATTKGGVIVSAKNIYFMPRIRPGVRVGTELIDYIENSYKN